jgi:hypothetical protein
VLLLHLGPARHQRRHLILGLLLVALQLGLILLALDLVPLAPQLLLMRERLSTAYVRERAPGYWAPYWAVHAGNAPYRPARQRSPSLGRRARRSTWHGVG